MAISTIFSALTNLLIYSADNSNQAKNAMFWTVGSLVVAKWDVLLFPFIILVIVIAFVMSKSLDILLLDDDSAIGFIGLVVPHICRTIAGSDHKKVS